MMIDEAFSAVPRKYFLPQEALPHTDEDRPLPIGYGQTNSQPTTVRRMLEWLDVKPGQHILDVGSGSGWTSALLATLVGPSGNVTAVEIIPELVEFGRKNCQNLNIPNIDFERANGIIGWPEKSPYDRILVSAQTDKIPKHLIEQLAAPGIMAIPVNGSIIQLFKQADGYVYKIEHKGYAFVPLIGGSRI